MEWIGIKFREPFLGCWDVKSSGELKNEWWRDCNTGFSEPGTTR
jgi:hypothetical protein